MGEFKGYGKGFKAGDNKIQSKPRPRYVLRITLGDIAKARGCHVDTVKRHVKAGRFNPRNLLSITMYIIER